MTTKVDAVQLDVGLIRQDMDKIHSRLSTAEQRLGHVEDTVESHGADLRTLHTKIRALEYKAEEAEAWLRGWRVSARWSLWRSYCASSYHRPSSHPSMLLRGPIASHPSGPGAPPPTFILKFLNFRDRDEVLRVARVLIYQNNKILIFPDYSVETQKLRCLF